MSSPPFFRFVLHLFAGLTLVLAGCRSSVRLPAFPASTGYRPSLPVQRADTTAAARVTERLLPPAQPVKAEAPPQGAATVRRVLVAKPPRASKVGERPAITVRGDTTASALRPVAPPVPRKSSWFKWPSAQTLVHYSLHFLFPVVLALIFFPAMWQTAYLLMLATMLIDLDHLLATPIFDPMRCSIGYHPLHSFYAIPLYALLLLFPATRIIAVGLLFHIVTDTIDCLWSFSHCHACYLNSRIHALLNWLR